MTRRPRPWRHSGPPDARPARSAHANDRGYSVQERVGRLPARTWPSTFVCSLTLCWVALMAKVRRPVSQGDPSAARANVATMGSHAWIEARMRAAAEAGAGSLWSLLRHLIQLPVAVE